MTADSAENMDYGTGLGSLGRKDSAEPQLYHMSPHDCVVEGVVVARDAVGNYCEWNAACSDNLDCRKSPNSDTSLVHVTRLQSFESQELKCPC